MDKVSLTLRVYFEDPFWIGICERISEGKLSVCKITFGAEPKDYEVEAYIISLWYRMKFSPSIVAVVKQYDYINPKRLQRNVKKQISEIRIGTKSQQALKLQHEESVIQRKLRTKQQMEEVKERLYALKQEKRKEKHKGR